MFCVTILKHCFMRDQLNCSTYQVMIISILPISRNVLLVHSIVYSQFYCHTSLTPFRSNSNHFLNCILNVCPNRMYKFGFSEYNGVCTEFLPQSL